MPTNICFDCLNAVPDHEGHGCPWSRKFEPVPGWTATPNVLTPSSQPVKTFHITDCPQFIPDERETKERSGYNVPVECVETGVIYSSLTAAGKAIGRSMYGISEAIRERDGYAYGYHWRLVKKGRTIA